MITQAAAIRALADGKVVEIADAEFVLEWGELKRRAKGSSQWRKAAFFCDVVSVSERYPLTFNEAHMKMKSDGCSVSRKSDPEYCVYIVDVHGKDTFYRKRLDGVGLAKPVFFGPDAFEDMWRVVE